MSELRMYCLVGAPGHGKSLLGKKLADHVGGTYIDKDIVCNRVFPDWLSHARAGSSHNFEIDFYYHERAVACMLIDVLDILRSGKSVVFTNTFSKSQVQAHLIDFLAGRGSQFSFLAARLNGRLSREQISARIESRSPDDPSPINTVELYDISWNFQRELYENTHPDDHWMRFDSIIDTSVLGIDKSFEKLCVDFGV